MSLITFILLSLKKNSHSIYLSVHFHMLSLKCIDFSFRYYRRLILSHRLSIDMRRQTIFMNFFTHSSCEANDNLIYWNWFFFRSTTRHPYTIDRPRQRTSKNVGAAVSLIESITTKLDY